MPRLILIIMSLIFISMPCFAEVQKEEWYVNKWCSGFGAIEVPVEDVSNPPRCDCMTENFAVEADFGYKWYEGVTQAQFYATKLNKLPGLLIIMKDQGDIIYIKRLFQTIKEQKIVLRIWIIDSEGNPVDIR